MSKRPASPPRIPGAEYEDYLGSGGFADVYLYQQSIPSRRVAVKVTRRGITDSTREAFRRETNMMARISSHPSILSVFGAGETDDGRLYLMMEYCPPPNLAGRIRNNPMPVNKALEIGIQMAGATETMHRNGIIHRDIKPANILITAFGHPVLTDFGIAQPVSEQQEKAEGFSVPWAPPEQATGEGPLGFSSDIYSLAATIYTMLASRAPFAVEDGDNSEIAVINRVLRAPVPAIGRPDVPEELERVLITAMAKNPRNRYQSAIDFAHALQSVQVSLHQVPTPIDVLVDENTSAPVADDDDATRAAVRRIDALPNQAATSRQPTTRPVTRETYNDDPVVGYADGRDPNAQTEERPPETDAGSAAQAQANARMGAAPNSARNAEFGTRPGTTNVWAGATTERAPMRVTREGAEAPEGAEESEDKPKRRPAALIAGGVGAALLLGGGIWIISTGAGRTIEPEPTRSVANPPATVLPDYVPPVQGIQGELQGNNVEFTWSYPDMADGYSFIVEDVSPQRANPQQTVTEMSVEIEAIRPSTCIRVTVLSPAGRQSEPLEECVNLGIFDLDTNTPATTSEPAN